MRNAFPRRLNAMRRRLRQGEERELRSQQAEAWLAGM